MIIVKGTWRNLLRVSTLWIRVFKYLFDNIHLIFEYKNDLSLLKDMHETVSRSLRDTDFDCNHKNYNVVTMDIRIKYLEFYVRYFPKRMVEINKYVLAIKNLKTEYAIKVRSGKSKFTINGKCVWAKSLKHAWGVYYRDNV